MDLITALDVPPSLAGGPSTTPPVRVGLVQHHWREDPDELQPVLADGVAQAAAVGAHVVFLPELTLSRYPADAVPTGLPSATAEDLLTGPTAAFAARVAEQHGIFVHASL